MTRTRAFHGLVLLMIGGAVLAQVPEVYAATGSPAREVSGRTGQMVAVDALSPTDAWAVGSAGYEGPARPLVEHWDGSEWHRIPVPHPRHHGELQSVSAISADDVWASGYSGAEVGGRPLVLHWDGTSWTRSSIEGLGSGIAYGISGDASNDVWVVGGSAFGGDSSFIEHWDGSTWTRVTNPSGATLRGVSAVSPTDAWTVGYLHRGRWKETTVAQHWDGASWTVVPTINPHYRANDLWAVSALPSGQAWAVGSWGSSHTLVEQWDGSAWTKQASPSPYDSALDAVSADAPRDAWAVGKQGSATPANLMLHWDGTGWTKVTGPKPGNESELWGVSADAPDDVWAVGWTRDLGQNDTSTWVEHWNGHHWSRS